MFETLIIQPIFNLLLVIYSFLPGRDFGVAIIVFTIVVRLALWPLVKRQLHNTRVMRAMQPQIKKIKERTKGDKQKEAQALTELYKERGVNPFGSLLILLIQLPILIGLFSALRSLNDPVRIVSLPYSFVTHTEVVEGIEDNIASQTGESIDELRAMPRDELQATLDESFDEDAQFIDQTMFGFIDLSKSGWDNGSFYWPLVIIAILAGIGQFFQTKQMMPDQQQSRSLRQILRSEADGKKADQSEINAAAMKNMRYFFPVITTFFALNFPGALALYWAAGSGIAVLQQRIILSRDVEEMEDIADEDLPTKKLKSGTKVKRSRDESSEEKSDTKKSDVGSKKSTASSKSKSKSSTRRKRAKG